MINNSLIHPTSIARTDYLRRQADEWRRAQLATRDPEESSTRRRTLRGLTRGTMRALELLRPRRVARA